VNTFSKKSYDLIGEKSGKATGSSSKEEEEDDDDDDEEEEDEDNLASEDDEISQVDTFRKILPYLKPHESIMKAIKRLGKSSASASSGSLSASQRWLKKKGQPETGDKMDTGESGSSSGVDKEALEKLTGYANYFIDQGFYDIYEETSESLQKKVDTYVNRSNGKQSEGGSSSAAASSFDIFAEDVDEKNLQPSTSGEQKGLEGKKIFILK
jgi:hypothetical protein